MQIITTIERQLHDPLVLDYRAQSGALGYQQRRSPRHLEVLTHVTHFQREIDSSHGFHLEIDITACRCLETGGFRLDIVDARHQKGNGVVASPVCFQSANLVGGHVGDCDACAGNHSAGGVRHGSSDFTESLRSQRPSAARH